MSFEDEVQKIATVLVRECPNLIAIYHFGSTAPQNRIYAQSESDIDLAYLTRIPISPERHFQLKLSISQSTERPIDLVNLRTANSVIIHQILETGTLILDRDPKAVGLWEVTEMAKYCQLNEERSEILQQVGKRGRIASE